MRAELLQELGNNTLSLLEERGVINAFRQSERLSDGESQIFDVEFEDGQTREVAFTCAGALPRFGEMVAINLDGDHEPIVEANHHYCAAIINGWVDDLIS